MGLNLLQACSTVAVGLNQPRQAAYFIKPAMPGTYYL